MSHFKNGFYDFTDQFIDVPITGKTNEWEVYQLNGSVEFTTANDSFDYDYGDISTTHKMPDYIEDISTEHLEVTKLSVSEGHEPELLEKCPDDLSEHLKENLLNDYFG